MVMDEFSFPTNFNHFCLPLSPPSQSSTSRALAGHQRENNGGRKSYSCADQRVMNSVALDYYVCVSDLEDQEEKMDMLWEDFYVERFSEEKNSDSRFSSDSGSGKFIIPQNFSSESKLVIPDNSTTSRKSTKFGALKALKKLFFLHNSVMRINLKKRGQ